MVASTSLNLSKNSLTEKCYFIASSSLKIKYGKSIGMQEKVSIMASLVMPISDLRDRFFYPHHTHMKDIEDI